MKNFRDLSNERKIKLYREFNDGEITFESLETRHGIHPESFRNFLVECVEQQFQEYRKSSPSEISSALNEKRTTAALLVISVILIAAFIIECTILHSPALIPGIDLVQALCAAAFSFTVIDRFLALKDPDVFGYYRNTQANFPTSRQQIQVLAARFSLYGPGLMFALLILYL